MKAFSLEEYLKNPSRKVVTRDGRAAEILCTNYIGAPHIIAQVEGYDYSTSFHEDGRYANDRDDSDLDLFFAPEKKEGWINLYKDDRGYISTGSVYTSKEKAGTQVGRGDYLTTIKIEWEE